MMAVRHLSWICISQMKTLANMHLISGQLDAQMVQSNCTHAISKEHVKITIHGPSLLWEQSISQKKK
jgi:hypothetical protein